MPDSLRGRGYENVGLKLKMWACQKEAYDFDGFISRLEEIKALAVPVV